MTGRERLSELDLLRLLALPLLDALYPNLGKWTSLVVVLAASLLSAYAVHRLVERPGAAWMRARLRASLEPMRRPSGPSTFAGHGGWSGAGLDAAESHGRNPVDTAAVDTAPVDAAPVDASRI
ncbi:hypothetical protein [Actinomadura chokoriensis]|uniref:Uncharacterized protein n=1 Tax=Actinomadura chokoriensis TaxID=454156 RepID=A0ABV4QQ22_9ACTN